MTPPGATAGPVEKLLIRPTDHLATGVSQLHAIPGALGQRLEDSNAMIRAYQELDRVDAELMPIVRVGVIYPVTSREPGVRVGRTGSKSNEAVRRCLRREAGYVNTEAACVEARRVPRWER